MNQRAVQSWLRTMYLAHKGLPIQNMCRASSMGSGQISIAASCGPSRSGPGRDAGQSNTASDAGMGGDCPKVRSQYTPVS